MIKLTTIILAYLTTQTTQLNQINLYEQDFMGLEQKISKYQEPKLPKKPEPINYDLINKYALREEETTIEKYLTIKKHGLKNNSFNKNFYLTEKFNQYKKTRRKT